MSSLAGLRLVWPVALVVVAAVGCGGGGGGRDAGPDVGGDVSGDVIAQETGMEAPSPDVTTDGGTDADAGPGTPDAQPDATDAADAGPDGADAAPDATDGNDGPADDRPADAMDGPPVMDAASEEGPPPPPVMLTVDAVLNTIVLDRCTNLTPATLMDVTAGPHTIALTASNLSKGSVSDPNDDPVMSFDDYVIVHLPLAAGDAASRRLFMLNGVGTMKSFTLSAAGTVRLMFIDSDADFNEGQATVTLDGTGASATVQAMANVLPWNRGCSSTPASITVTSGMHRATLTESTLSAGGGSVDDFVLLRLPSERPMDPFRFVILNGVGASVDFTPYLGQTIRAWFVAPTIGATGRATIVVTDI